MKLLYYASIASIFAFPVLAQQCYYAEEALEKLVEDKYELRFMDVEGQPDIILSVTPNGKWVMAYILNDKLCVIATGDHGSFVPLPPNL